MQAGGETENIGIDVAFSTLPDCRVWILSVSSLGSFWEWNDSLPIGVAFQDIRIISLRVRTVVPVMLGIVFRRFFDVSGGRRLDNDRLRIRVIGRIRIVRIIGSICRRRPDRAAEHDSDGRP